MTNENKKYHSLSLEELETLEKFIPDKRTEFLEAYVAKFKKDNDPFHNMTVLKRGYYIWERRTPGMKRMEVLRKKAHTLMIPAVIKTKSPHKSRSDNFPDVGELMAKCNNMLAELIVIQKEQLSLFQKLANKV